MKKQPADKQFDKLMVLDLIKTGLGNPLVVAIAGTAVNYAAYKSGFYNDAPDLSILGGPVWFTIGKATDPAVDMYSRNEAVILSIAMAMALSPAIKTGLQTAGTAIKDMGPAAMAVLA